MATSLKERKIVALLPTMGAGDMPDNEPIKAELIKRGAAIISQNILNRFEYGLVPWEAVNIVNLQNMRGSLTQFADYKGILRALEEIKKARNSAANDLHMIPDFDVIEWVAAKEKYLKHFNEAAVSIIPTQYISRKNEEGGPEIEQALDQIQSYIEGSPKKSFVIKPSVSALAVGLIFIHKQDDGQGYEIEFPHQDKKSERHKFKDFAELRDKSLYMYLNNTTSPNDVFLLQDFVENQEFSAVFVNGTPHFVRRDTGDKKIAHGNFGGKDTVFQPDDPKMIEFIEKVINAMPEELRRSNFLRIDVMRLADGNYILSEIEGAGATRLWLKESGRAGEYAQMLIDIAKGEHTPRKLSVSDFKHAATALSSGADATQILPAITETPRRRATDRPPSP